VFARLALYHLGHACSPHFFYISSLADGFLGWFHSLAIVNGTDINTGVQVSILYADLCSLGYMLNSAMRGSYGRSQFFKETS
jgi:hypothetical protein